MSSTLIPAKGSVGFAAAASVAMQRYLELMEPLRLLREPIYLKALSSAFEDGILAQSLTITLLQKEERAG